MKFYQEKELLTELDYNTDMDDAEAAKKEMTKSLKSAIRSFNKKTETKKVAHIENYLSNRAT